MKKRLWGAGIAACAVLSAGFVLAGCGGSSVSVAGTYTQSLSSGEYYSEETVQDFLDTHGFSGQIASFWALEDFWGSLTAGILDDEGEFLTSGGVEDYYTATLTLDDSGSYSLTKEIKVDSKDDESSGLVTSLGFTSDSSDAAVTLTFSGTYTADGSSVTLAAPTALTGSVVTVGVDSMAGYFPFEGNYAEISVTSDEADDLLYPGKFFYYFNGLYFTESDAFTEMTVTVDTETSALTIA